MTSSFALCFEGRLTSALARCRASVTDLGPVRTTRPWQVARARTQLASLIERAQPDVVLVHSAWSQALLGPAVRRTGRRLVRWLHAPDPGNRWLELAAARVRLDLLICNSKYTDEASRARFPGVPREVCYAPAAKQSARARHRAVRARSARPVASVPARLPWARRPHGAQVRDARAAPSERARQTSLEQSAKLDVIREDSPPHASVSRIRSTPPNMLPLWTCNARSGRVPDIQAARARGTPGDTCANLAANLANENRATAAWRADWPSVSRRCWSRTSCSTLRASVSASPGGAVSASTPGRTNSEAPPVALVTTARPVLMASAITRPNGSGDVLAWTATSSARSAAPRSPGIRRTRRAPRDRAVRHAPRNSSRLTWLPGV